MKKGKQYIFVINNRPVDKINGEDIYFDNLTQFKRDLAAAHQVPIESIEVIPEDIYEPDYSRTLCVCPTGLQFRPDNQYASWRAVDCPTPAMDISDNDHFQDFLDLLGKNDIDNAITFI